MDDALCIFHNDYSSPLQNPEGIFLRSLPWETVKIHGGKVQGFLPLTLVKTEIWNMAQLFLNIATYESPYHWVTALASAPGKKISPVS